MKKKTKPKTTNPKNAWRKNKTLQSQTGNVLPFQKPQIKISTIVVVRNERGFSNTVCFLEKKRAQCLLLAWKICYSCSAEDMATNVCQHFQIRFQAAAEQGGVTIKIVQKLCLLPPTHTERKPESAWNENRALPICVWQSSQDNAPVPTAWTELWDVPWHSWEDKEDPSSWVSEKLAQKILQ